MGIAMTVWFVTDYLQNMWDDGINDCWVSLLRITEEMTFVYRSDALGNTLDMAWGYHSDALERGAETLIGHF